MVPISDVKIHLPMEVKGFVDYVGSKDHAERAGRVFGNSDVPPNFYNISMAYSGRAASVTLCGGDIIRPWVQSRPDTGATPNWGPSKAIDYELELVSAGLTELTTGMFRSQRQRTL